MKTIQLAVAALMLAGIALTSSGCLVAHHDRSYSRGRVYEPSGAEVYQGDRRYDERYDHRFPEGRDYRRDRYDGHDGYYDSQGFWHPYQYGR